jgi:hypothetical protein
MRSLEPWRDEEFGGFGDEDPQLWAMRDYFWMLRSDVLEHAAEVWRSFRAGYRAYGSAAAGTDSIPPAPGRRAASESVS